MFVIKLIVIEYSTEHLLQLVLPASIIITLEQLSDYLGTYIFRSILFWLLNIPIVLIC